MNLPRLHLRAGYFGIGPVLVACLFALTLTDILWMSLRMHQHYPDPVAGWIGWSATDKGRDMRALMLLLGGASVLALGITALGRSLTTLGNEIDITTSVNQFLLFSLIPAGYRLAVGCVSPANEFPPLQYLSVFPLGAVLALLMLRRYRKELRPKDLFTLGGAILLTPILAMFSALGILLALCRVWPPLIARIAPYGSKATVVVVIIAIAVVFAAFILSPTLELFRRRLLRTLMGSQYPAVLLVLFLVPPYLVDASKQFRNPYPLALVVTLSCISLACAGLMYRRFRSSVIDQDFSLGRAIAPVAVMAITIYCVCQTAGLPVAYGEFFHAGEGLTPWQQIWDCHCIPYVDFAPVHGLMEIVTGALNQMFFDGSAAHYTEAAALLCGLSVAALSLSASLCVSSVGALVFVLAIVPGDRFFFLAPALFVIAAPRSLARPVRWLVLWIILSILSCGYNGALGPAFVLSTVPIAIWQMWRAITNHRKPLALLIAALLLIGAAFIAIAPLRIFSLAFIHFVLDNAWTNEAANGIAWADSAWKRDNHTGLGTSQLLWELTRFGFISVLLGALVLNWKQWSKPPRQRSIPVIALSASVALVLFWSSFWIIERIDAGGVSRPGAMTDVAIYLILPGLVLTAVPIKRAGATALMLTTLMGVYSKGLPSNIDPDVLTQRPFQTRFLPADTVMIDGSTIGIPRLGQVIKPVPDFIPDLLNLKKDLAQLLKPGETYFDLTNLTANYYYLDLPSPGQYAPYVAANSKMQAAMMRHVREHPNVPVALIMPSGVLDGVSVSLRCYRPYHDFLLKDTVYEKDGYMFLVDPARNPSAGPVGTEAQLQRLDTVFRQENLQRLPIAWGDSFAPMRNRFQSIASAPFTEAVPAAKATDISWSCRIPEASNSGVAADFVLLHCDFVPTDGPAYRGARRAEPPTGFGEPQFMLTWTGAHGEVSAPIKFLGQSGDLLIPLGAYPRWLLGSGFQTLNLTLQNPRCAKTISVSRADFYKLIPL